MGKTLLQLLPLPMIQHGESCGVPSVVVDRSNNGSSTLRFTYVYYIAAPTGSAVRDVRDESWYMYSGHGCKYLDSSHSAAICYRCACQILAYVCICVHHAPCNWPHMCSLQMIYRVKSYLQVCGY